jgi:periplasmic protein TonB
MQIGPRPYSRAASAVAALLVQCLLVWALMLNGSDAPVPEQPSGPRLVPVTVEVAPKPRPTPATRRGKSRPKDAEGAPNRRRVPKELVTPPPVIPVPHPSPIIAPPVASRGAAAEAGAAPVPGPGTGSGQAGMGLGGGGRGGAGYGDDLGGEPPRWRRGRLKNSDYPSGAAEAGLEGTVAVRYRVGVDGRVSNCVVTTSSGHADLDAVTCRLIERRFRFDPATDEEGRPVASTIVERHSWIMQIEPPQPPKTR